MINEYTNMAHESNESMAVISTQFEPNLCLNMEQESQSNDCRTKAIVNSDQLVNICDDQNCPKNQTSLTTDLATKDSKQSDSNHAICTQSISSSNQLGLSSTKKLSSSNSNVASSCDIGAEERSQQVRLLVRRREAGAIIGKAGSNIKRLRESFKSSIFSIPDSGNGPERVVCIVTNRESMSLILSDITRLLLEKSAHRDEQIELKILIHTSHAGTIIGIGGQQIKRLRNESKAAIKIYEMCCPFSNERVCAIKARPKIVVETIGQIFKLLQENKIKGTSKAYDAVNFDLNLVDKYGGFLPDEPNTVQMIPLTYPYELHFFDNLYEDSHRQYSLLLKSAQQQQQQRNYNKYLTNFIDTNQAQFKASPIGQSNSPNSNEQKSSASTSQSNHGLDTFPIRPHSLPISAAKSFKNNSQQMNYRFHPYLNQVRPDYNHNIMNQFQNFIQNRAQFDRPRDILGHNFRAPMIHPTNQSALFGLRDPVRVDESQVKAIQQAQVNCLCMLMPYDISVKPSPKLNNTSSPCNSRALCNDSCIHDMVPKIKTGSPTRDANLNIESNNKYSTGPMSKRN